MGAIKASVALPSGKVYLFQDQSYLRFDFLTGAADDTLQTTGAQWNGLYPDAPDAAAYWGCEQIYFFYGDTFVRYDLRTDAVAPDYRPPNAPRTIDGNWPGLWTDGVDAAVNWGNGKIYFFKAGEYVRYDMVADKADEDYPRPIDGNWGGIWTDGIDAVFYQGGTMAYFIRGVTCREYNVASDQVEREFEIDLQSGVSTQLFDQVPPGMLTAARDLSLPSANQVMAYLIDHGQLSLNAAQTPYSGTWLSGVSSPGPNVHVVVKPAVINNVQFEYMNTTGATVLDNIDQRMVVALYRLTRWLNGSVPTVSVIRHLGIGHGGANPLDCHNQGRALDLSGLEGDVSNVPFALNVLNDWGNLAPAPGGGPLRLDPSINEPAYILFRTAFAFGSLECESNGIGPTNKWPPTAIGEVGGMVIHPDYIDQPNGQPLRAAHQDHIHMQIGITKP